MKSYEEEVIRLESKSLKYRPEIDGLRAIAVLLVVFFHAFPTVLPGGFIGVDVFFVISGYLITQILLKQIEQRTFSYSEFYGRRFRRILPALILVLLVVLLAGKMLLLPSDLESLGKHTAASALFANNILLWKESNYFATASDQKPLLHLWSLSIEEQFYLLWPTILVFAYKRGANLKIVTCVIFIVSFLLNVLVVGGHPVPAFYLLPFRFWELLAGCALAIFLQREASFKIDKMQSTSAEISSLLGLILLFVGVVAIDQQKAYPGYWALLPVAASVLIILGGNSKVGRLLSFKPLLFIGLISYPLYLWHWPLLSIARLKIDEPSAILRIVLVTISIALATLTWILIEKPIQRFNWSSLSSGFAIKRFIALSIGILIAFVLVGLITARGYLRTERDKKVMSILSSYAQSFEKDYGGGTCFFPVPVNSKPVFDPSCFTPNGKPSKILIWGNSFAGHLYPGLKKLLSESSVQVMEMASCRPLINQLNRPNKFCDDLTEETFQRINAARPLVIMASNWINEVHLPEFFPTLDQTLSRLESMGIDVIVISQLPMWNGGLLRTVESAFLFKDLPVPDRSNRNLTERAFEVSNRMKEHFKDRQFERVELVSPIDRLCDRNGCTIKVGSDLRSDLISFDEGHLTPEGSAYFASTVLRPALLHRFPILNTELK